MTNERNAVAVLVDPFAFDTDAWADELSVEVERMNRVRYAFEAADRLIAAGLRQEHKPRGPQHDALVAATDEAMIRNPPNHIVDDPFGATGEAESDPYGYDKEARRHFVAGALFEHRRTA